MLAVDFFTVETISLQRFYMLFIELDSRRIHLAGSALSAHHLTASMRRDRLGGLLHEYSLAA
jgi:hypothetical protein